MEELSIDCRIITVKPVFKEQDGDVDYLDDIVVELNVFLTVHHELTIH